jgi:hypothetical protein
MTLKQLLDILQKIQSEICCDGKTINSHNIQSCVEFLYDNISLDIDDVRMELLPGCGCPYGVTFVLKTKK